MNGWTLGADGSHWAGAIDFQKMRQAGARFYIGKASDSYRGSGKLFEDSKFKEHFDQAFSLGQLLLGNFHWLQPDTDPIKAADFYLELYFRYPFHFMPLLDFEETYAYQDKDGNPTHLESHYCWCAEVWLDRVMAHTGRLPMVYSAKWFTDHFEKRLLGFLNQYPLWAAQYPWFVTPFTRPSLPYPWQNWMMWQFSADGNKRGSEFGVTAESIDLNYFQGSYDDLLSWLDTDQPTPIEPPQPEGTMYVIEMLGNLTIRTGPAVSYPKTGGYALTGETYHATEEKNGWYHIEGGWISGLAQWTRITEVEDSEPEPTPPTPLTLEQRVARLEKAVFG